MEFASVHDVAVAYKAGEISLDEAVSYITDRWEWPDRTSDSIVNEEDLTYPEFGADNASLLHDTSIFDGHEEVAAFVNAVFDRVTELLASGEISPRPLPR